MELIIDKTLTTAAQVRNHPLFGKAVFVECGLYEPKKFSYDHHDGSSSMRMCACEQVQQDLLKGREMPTTLIFNSIRGFDNFVALYLLWYRDLIRQPDTGKMVSAAAVMDRVGPSASSAIDPFVLAMLETAQELVPFKEFEIANEELQKTALKVINSLKRRVTAASGMVKYSTVHDLKGKFIIATSEEAIRNTLYDQGYKAYGVFCSMDNGNSKWTLARISEYVPFNLMVAFQFLNELEAKALGVVVSELKANWMGRDVVGGSPRNVGTVLSEPVVSAALQKCWEMPEFEEDEEGASEAREWFKSTLEELLALVS